MGKIISIANNKGGVGKTTSVGISSQILAAIGKRVLDIDLDPQGNLSMLLGKYIEDSENVINGIESSPSPNIAELFKYRLRTREEVEALIQPTSMENLDIIPSSKRHKNTILNISTNQTGNNNIILRKALLTISNNYDYIFIDNAPASDIMTVNSMFASDIVLVPVRMEGFSYKGLRETMETILYIKKEHELDSLQFGGVFISQAEINTNIFKGLHENYSFELGDKFLKTPIRKDISIAEIETNFVSILEHSPDTNAIFDYTKLLLESNILDEDTEQALKSAIEI